MEHPPHVAHDAGGDIAVGHAVHEHGDAVRSVEIDDDRHRAQCTS